MINVTACSIETYQIFGLTSLLKDSPRDTLSLNRKLSSFREEAPWKGFAFSRGDGVLGMLPGVWLPPSPWSNRCSWDRSKLKTPAFPPQALGVGASPGVSERDISSPVSRLSMDLLSEALSRSSSLPTLSPRGLRSRRGSRRFAPLLRLSSKLP